VAEGDLQRIVGLNLARVRHARGLTQEDLADELGFHRTYVGSLERGERNLSLKAVERLADSLRVNPLDLLKPPRGRRR
jgi:transcriptional regulator with XRE-family HTH domain